MKINTGKNKVGKIGVLYGGWSTEREVSLVSGKAVFTAVKELGYNAELIDFRRDWWKTRLDLSKYGFIFNILHGTNGEDGKLQGLLDLLGVKYSGCGALASALAMDKVKAKQVFVSQGIPTPEYQVICCTGRSNKVEVLPFPVVVKPVSEGSAVGISVVKKRKDFNAAVLAAAKYNGEALVEKYIPGYELTVGIVGDKVLPVVEILPKNEFYDYESKYAVGGSRHVVPAKIPHGATVEVQRIAYAAHKALGCEVVSRVDVRLTPSLKPYVLEVNTIPGMTPTSLLPDAARAAGFGFNNLVDTIIKLSLDKYR
ncbi:MAG: D-alanine--D-alanine ligase [Elusimicrobiota bacterium]